MASPRGVAVSFDRARRRDLHLAARGFGRMRDEIFENGPFLMLFASALKQEFDSLHSIQFL